MFLFLVLGSGARDLAHKGVSSQMTRRSPRSLTLDRIPLSSQDRFIKVTISYCEGGVSMITGRDSTRGYYLSTVPVTSTDGVETYLMLSGFKALVEPARRFSAARLQCLSQSALSSHKLPDLIRKTLAQSGECVAP